MNPRPVVATLMLVFLAGRADAQNSNSWHDPSPHTAQFVTVDADVKLEVLDWGGTGQPLVLLTGLGNTAHVFDDFAPKLTDQYHVYGITRRGYGASSRPAAGYSADRLGDDVLAVLDALKIRQALLVGHSIAGEELSSIGSRHPERVVALIYLDAAYSEAYYGLPGPDRVGFDLPELQKELRLFQQQDKPLDEHRQVVRKLLQESLPALSQDLEQIQQLLDAVPAQLQSGPTPTDDDLASFAAYRAWRLRTQGFAGPEAEFRQQREVRPDGGVGKPRDDSAVADAIFAGEQKYREIRAPILAIYANPRRPGPNPYNTPAERAEGVRLEAEAIDATAKAFQKQFPTAHVVQIPQANHYVFVSNEADVLREMHAFLKDLQ
jgi:non-heme chloroperoxidase